jgi:hypothetical protein
MALVWVAGCVSAHEDETPNVADDGRDNPADNSLAANRARVATSAACIDDGGVTPLLEPKVIQLWPPNHKFHDIAISDCVDITAACGDTVRAEFTWASSDEPVDDLGDGHFAPDIELSDDCEHLAVRAERQGPKNGRVYKLGVRVIDSAGGISDSVCSVIVDHDQRGVVGEDSGEAYRIEFDGTQGTQTCDGTQPPPPTNPPPPPPTNPPPPPTNPPPPGEAPL